MATLKISTTTTINKSEVLSVYRDEIDDNSMAHVEALIITSGDSLDAEISAVWVGAKNVSSYLTFDAEISLRNFMRTYYLNNARSGHEGDSFNEVGT
jgi:hypothetical protein